MSDTDLDFTDQRRCILFVDDEPRIIEGIRRMLRPLRDQWQVLTAGSGAEALELLERHDVDVVISDMRMPVMDGAELLRQVKERFPKVVRIILSGQSDRDSILRAIGPTHQYLSKPCAPEALRATLTRACQLRDTLNHPGLAAIISRLSSLPTLPSSYQRLVQELQAPAPSLTRIAEAISDDLGMSAKILQLVNFSLFRANRTVTTPAEAAMALGLENLRSLVLGAGIFAQEEQDPSHVAIWEHGKRVGTLARAIASAEGLPREEVSLCFTAGVLHDCGRVVLSGHYEEAGDLATRTHLTGAERRRFGAAHPQIGAYLLGLWGLPYPLVEAVAHHHQPQGGPSVGFSPLTAVHVAECLISECEGGTEEHCELDQTYLQGLGVLPRIATWRGLAQTVHHTLTGVPATDSP